MNFKKWLPVGLALAAILFVSCAGVEFEYSTANYLDRQLSELPADLLNSRIVLNEEGQTLLGSPFSVGEFVVYMMAAEPLERNSWINVYVAAKEEGSVITLKKYTRGKLVLVNTINLGYQDGTAQSRVDSIVWDDRRMGEKMELVSIEDKASYALLVATYLVIQ